MGKVMLAETKHTAAMVFSCLLLALALAACGGTPQPTPADGHTTIATTIVMPDFELPDTSGSTVSLLKTLSHSHFAVLVFYRGHF